METYFLLTDDFEQNNGNECKQGLNFFDISTSESNKSGFRIAKKNQIHFLYKKNQKYLWTVELAPYYAFPNMYQMVSINGEGKRHTSFVVDKIILIDRFPLSSYETYEKMDIPYPNINLVLENKWQELAIHIIKRNQYSTIKLILLSFRNGCWEIIKFVLQDTYANNKYYLLSVLSISLLCMIQIIVRLFMDN